MIEEMLPQAIFTIEGRKKILTAYGQTLYDLLAPQFSQTQGLIQQAVDSHEIILKEFFSNRLRIVIPKKILKIKPTSINGLAKQIENLPALHYKEDDSVVQNFLLEFGITYSALSIYRICPNYNSIVKMLNKGMGWAVIPTDSEINEDKFHIYHLKGRTPDVRQFYLCYRKEFKNSVWFKEIIAEFKNFSKAEMASN